LDSVVSLKISFAGNHFFPEIDRGRRARHLGKQLKVRSAAPKKAERQSPEEATVGADHSDQVTP